MSEEFVSVRYIVNEVGEAIDFLYAPSRFRRAAECSTGLRVGHARQTPSSAERSGQLRRSPDAGWTQPVAGGWTRILIIVPNLPAEVDRLRSSGLSFRSEIISGVGGSQILLEDPSGNPIELFEPAH